MFNKYLEKYKILTNKAGRKQLRRQKHDEFNIFRMIEIHYFKESFTFDVNTEHQLMSRDHVKSLQTPSEC